MHQKQTKERSFDLTSVYAFMAKPQWADNIVAIAKARMGNLETPTGPLVWVVLRTSSTSLHISIGFGGKESVSQIAMLPCTLMRWTAFARHGGT